MKVLECELHKYIRMSTSGKDHFFYKPEQPIQIIIGTNGSGKSSLMEELFPFAAQAADYGKGGSKRVRYSHNNKIYEVYSFFKTSSSMRHEFRVQNESGEWVNLNGGGTQREQNDLAEEHFGVTALIRSVLLSHTNFSSMDPSQRRTLFTLISDADYTFAFKLYDDTNLAIRSNAGVVNFLKDQITTKVANLLSEEETISLKKEVSSLHSELNELYQLRRPGKQTSSQIEIQIRNKANELRQILDRINQLEISYPTFTTTTDPVHLKEPLTALDRDEYLLKNKIATEQELYTKIKNELQVLEKTGGRDKAVVAKDIEDIAQRIKELRLLLSRDWGFESSTLRTTLHSFTDLYPSLNQIFTEQQDNSENAFTMTRLKELNEKYEVLLKQKEDLTRSQYKVRSEIEHYEYHRNTKATTCPKCSHSWHVGFDQAKYDQAKKLGVDLEVREETLVKTMQEIKEEIQLIDGFMQRYTSYLQIRNTNPLLKPLWDVLQDDHLAFKWPREALRVIQQLDTDKTHLLELEQLTRRKNELEIIFNQLQSIDMAKIEGDAVKLQDIELRVAEYTDALKRIAVDKKQIEDYLEQIEIVTKLENSMERALMTLDELDTELLDQVRHECIEDGIQLIQSKLSTKEHVLRNVENEAKQIEELKTRLTEHEVRHQCLQLILKGLSPTEGLIAEGLTGFINNFLEQMNKVINSIWSYEMEILTCDMEENAKAGLNYRFPLRVEGKPNNLKDIKDGSSAMRQITDLAYRIVFMKYLGLEEMPLFLDEFGSGFDAYHQNASINAIKSIIEKMGFEQTFIISHHESIYGGLANAELCVVCDRNVVIPKDIPRIV